MEYKDLGKYVFKLSNQIKRTVDNSISQYGLTCTQSKVINYIYDNYSVRELYQRDIEEEFDIRRSSVTSILQLLEKNGYIKRVSVANDARLKKIELTESGIKVHNTVQNTILNMEATFSETLSEEEMQKFIEMMDRLSNRIGNK